MARKKYLLTGVQFLLLFNSAFLSFGAKWSARLCAVLRYLRTLLQRAGIMSAKLHSDGSWDPQSFKRSDLSMRNTETSLFKKGIFSSMVLKITAKSAEMMGIKRDTKPVKMDRVIPTNTIWTVSVLAALSGSQHFAVLISNSLYKQPDLALCMREISPLAVEIEITDVVAAKCKECNQLCKL